MTTAAASLGNSNGGFSSAHGGTTPLPVAGSSTTGRPLQASAGSTAGSGARRRGWLQLMSPLGSDPPPVPAGWYHQ